MTRASRILLRLVTMGTKLARRNLMVAPSATLIMRRALPCGLGAAPLQGAERREGFVHACTAHMQGAQLERLVLHLSKMASF
jgi:hypothetical protein